MCGFIFTTSKNYKKKQIIKSGKFIFSRGPEGNKYIQTNYFKSYHTRLKIMDIKNKKANLPIYDLKKNYFLFYNGEIYNFETLKLELLKKKIKFKTNGDSEVLFYFLKTFGIQKTLKKINGMFAFIFVDLRKKKIFAARDEFGQKPLYYSKNNNILTLSSSVRSIKNLTNFNDLDKQNIRIFLSSNSGLIPPNKTIFKDIMALEAGHYLSFSKNKFKIIKYFNPREYFYKNKYYINNNKSLRIIEKETTNTILQSIELHSISSRKRGIFLSGGLDSSLLYFFLKEKNYKIFKKKTYIKSLTVLHDKQLSYLPTTVNKIINKQLDKSNSIQFEKRDYFKNLINIIKFSGLPQRWGGGIPMYMCAKEFRKKNIRVIYSGDGADEMLCGYMDIIKSIKNNKNLYVFPYSLELNKNSIFYNDLDAKIYYRYLNNLRKQSIKKFKFLKNKSDILIKCLQCEYSEFFLQSCTAIQSDEYSMANSVEVRHPFINKIIFENLINLPSKAIANLKDNTNKVIFRNILKRHNYINHDKKKEGTRNYSKFISQKKYWNFESFYISKYLDLSKLSNWKEIYKVINLEIFIRVHLSKNFYIMLTPIGKKTLL